jgi:hypothetical protein
MGLRVTGLKYYWAAWDLVVRFGPNQHCAATERKPTHLHRTPHAAPPTTEWWLGFGTLAKQQRDPRRERRDAPAAACVCVLRAPIEDRDDD